MSRYSLLFVPLCAFAGAAFSATFGTAVPITGGATDLVLDEARGQLYIVNSTQNRIEVYSTRQRQLLGTMPTDQQPLAAAISRDGKYLYVTSYATSVLDVIDLDAQAVVSRISLPAAPQGVAVGANGRVLITTIGSSTTDTTTRLLLYDPDAAASNTLLNITATLPAPGTPTTPSAGQVFNSSRSHLIATPDGALIIGVNIPTTSTRSVFVYEVASASILRSRSVSNISSVLSVSPDGSRFMAGLSLFDTATLAIVAQQNSANSIYPFPQNVNFNLQQNQGGSIFAPDGTVLYSGFNIAPVGSTTTNSSQLMLNDPENLLIQLGLQLPENLTGKMVITSNAATIYALSQSGLLVLPVSTIYSNPIAALDTTAALLTNDQCGATSSTATAQVTVSNAGTGRMSATAQVLQSGVTFTFPLGGQTGAGSGTVIGGGGAGGGPGAGGPGQTIPIVLPGGGQVTIPPGTIPGTTTGLTTSQQTAVAQNAPQLAVRPTGSGAVLQFSFNSRAASSLGTGTPVDFLVQSPEAINIPARVRVYQNNRNAEATGTIIATPISVSTGEGLVDLVYDAARQRLYIANSGLNRLEVFDTTTNQFIAPIKVGQLPRSLAMSPDGNTLYVANTGGESISIVDLEQARVTGSVRFPPLTYNAGVALITPSVIAATLGGLQIVMSSGALWQAVNNEAMPRSTSTVIGSATLTAPRTIVATPGGEYALLLAGSGVGYLYDAMSDQYVLSQQVVSTPIQGYYGPVAAGPRGQYFVVNGQVLNQSLTPVASGMGPTSTTSRPVSAVAAVNTTTYARFVQPTRASTSAAVTSSPVIELVDVNTGGMQGPSASALEGPLSTQTGTQRVNVSARTMAVDSNGSIAYLLTASGLSVVSLNTGAAAQNRVQVNQNGVVNVASYLPEIAPGSLVAIFGQNLASDGTGSAPLPKILGGSCVTLDTQAVPLLLTSATQINVQIPPATTAGKHTLVIRRIGANSTSTQQSVTVAKYAPAVYVNPRTGQAAVYHQNGTPVSKSSPAKRDEPLTMYATGLGATKGGTVTAGNVAPSDPLAVTDPVQVFFGNPSYSQSAIIVDWSGLVPGYVGMYQLNLRVPGTHMKGDALPVTLRIGGVSSAATPTISVE